MAMLIRLPAFIPEWTCGRTSDESDPEQTFTQHQGAGLSILPWAAGCACMEGTKVVRMDVAVVDLAFVDRAAAGAAHPLAAAIGKLVAGVQAGLQYALPVGDLEGMAARLQDDAVGHAPNFKGTERPLRPSSRICILLLLPTGFRLRAHLRLVGTIDMNL